MTKPTLSYPLTDKQVIFDYVWHHFIVEKNPRAIDRDGCFYDSPAGGCAVGCLMPDDLRRDIGQHTFGIAYVWMDEFTPPGQDEELRPFRDRIKQAFDESTRDLLKSLQSAHDDGDSGNVKHFDRRLRVVAHTYGLTVPS